MRTAYLPSHLLPEAKIMNTLFRLIATALIAIFANTAIAETTTPTKATSEATKAESDATKAENKTTEAETTGPENSSPLIGKWEVSYTEIKEKAVYEIKEVDGKLQGYAIAFIDAAGNEEPNPENNLVLTDINSNDNKTTATYQITYEGETFDVLTQMTQTDDTIDNQYNYYGYAGKEIWSKRP